MILGLLFGVVDIFTNVLLVTCIHTMHAMLTSVSMSSSSGSRQVWRTLAILLRSCEGQTSRGRSGVRPPTTSSKHTRATMRFQPMNELATRLMKSTQRLVCVRACACPGNRRNSQRKHKHTSSLTYLRGQVVSLSRACNKMPIDKSVEGARPSRSQLVTGESLQCDNINVYKDELRTNARANGQPHPWQVANAAGRISRIES